MQVRPVLLLAMVACGSESSPKSGAGSAGSASGTAPAEAAAPVVIDASSVPRSARVEKVRAELPDLGSIQRVVLRPDRKLLVIGEKAIARVDEDLALDETFGTAGVVQLAVEQAQLQTAAVDEKRRVIVVGHVATKNHAEDLLVARLSPSGKLDQSFGNAGIVTRDFGDTDDRPSAVFAMPKGEIVVIGSHQQRKGAETYEGYLARLDKHGALSASVAFFDCIPGSREFITRAVVDGDGFIVGGYAFNDKAEDSGVFVARIGSDGKLDKGFGDRGVTRVHSAELGRSVAWELSTATNGDILLAGSSGEEIAKYRGFVMRFDAHGAVVPNWGQHGLAWGPPGVRWISMAASDGDGVLAVSRFDGSLLRFDANGEVDRGFGTEGIVKGEKDDTFDNAVVLDYGDVVIAGDKLLVRYAR